MTINYSVMAEYPDGDCFYDHLTAQTDRGAIRQMREYLKTVAKVPDLKLYLVWSRTSDGQQGYINQDGNAAITGQPWAYAMSERTGR